MISAVIAAAGRLEPAQAREYATDIKALARIGGKTLLATLVDALRGVPEIGRISVVGPRAVREGGLAVDEWSDERASGEENVIAALRSAGPSEGVRLRLSGPWPPGEFMKTLSESQ